MEQDGKPAKPLIAAAAARAATAVPGVARLEPGFTGLLAAAARSLHRQVTGVDPVSTDGVRVSFEDGGARVEVDVVVSGRDPAADVGRAVQRAVARAVREDTGVTPAAVVVKILDIAT
ncbi:Asp23/Gls24 family envelope stress response protein [Actinosynnema sp. NPDC020468]|uniref:Asp23/Gls24 family envelope stress response protein n=1 Tax=Actinosynnema sp. NPDC020468 TaxID=3154488 RepID=UPI0033CAE46B